MIDILQGKGAQWPEMTMSPTDIADALEALTEAERFELGFSDWHYKRGMEREAQTLESSGSAYHRSMTRLRWPSTTGTRGGHPAFA